MTTTGSHAVLCRNGDEARILDEVLKNLRLIVSRQRHGTVTVELAAKDDGSTRIGISVASSMQTTMRGLASE